MIKKFQNNRYIIVLMLILVMSSFPIFANGGISTTTTNIAKNWIGPIFILGTAGMSLMFLKDREFRKLISFLVICGIIGLMIYAGDSLFGEKGLFTNMGAGVANEVKTGVSGNMDKIQKN